MIEFLGAWLFEQFADGTCRRFSRWLLGSERARELHDVGRGAVKLAAKDLWSGRTEEDITYLASIIDQVFEARRLEDACTGQGTLLETLRASMADRIMVLDDCEITETGQSSAQNLGLTGSGISENLAQHVIAGILKQGWSRDSHLSGLANQLDHDVTHLQNDGMYGQLSRILRQFDQLSEVLAQGSRSTGQSSTVSLRRPLKESTALLCRWLEQVDDFCGERPAWVRHLHGPVGISRASLPEVASHGPTVVLGEPGSGKTEWLHAKVSEWAKRAMLQIAANSKPTIPLFVHASEVAVRLSRAVDPRTSEGLADADPRVVTIRESVRLIGRTMPPDDVVLLEEQLTHLLRSESADFIVAIDAADEAGGANIRRWIVPMVRDWCATRGCVAVVTGRDQIAYPSELCALLDKNDEPQRMLALSAEELGDLGDSWLGAHEAGEWLDYLRQAPSFYSNVIKQQGNAVGSASTSIGSNILLASIAFATINESRKRRSEQFPSLHIDSLYQSLIRRLLRHDWNEHFEGDEAIVERRLDNAAALAFASVLATKDRPYTVGAARREHREVATEAQVYVPLAPSLHEPSEEPLRWSHPSLQTWLAAHHLGRLPNEEAAEWLLGRWWHDPLWQEIAVFYAGRLADHTALFALLERDGKEDPLAVVDQLAVRIAIYLQRSDLALPALRRLVPLINAENPHLRSSTIDAIVQSGQDGIEEEYRSTLLSSEYCFERAVIARNPVALAMVKDFLFDRPQRQLSNDAHLVIDGAEAYIPTLSDGQLEQLAGQLDAFVYRLPEDLRVVEQLPPSYRLANTIFLELTRRGRFDDRPRRWALHTFFMPYHVGDLLSVGEVDRAFSVLLEQPFDDSQDLRTDFYKNCFARDDPQLRARLWRCVQDMRNPLCLRATMAIAAAKCDLTESRTDILEKLLKELVLGFEQLWGIGFKHVRRLYEAVPEAPDILHDLMFLRPDVEYFPVPVDEFGLHEGFRAAFWNEDILSEQTRREICRLLEYFGDRGESHIAGDVLFLGGPPEAHLDPEDLFEDDPEYLRTLTHVYPFSKARLASGAFVTLYLYFRDKIYHDSILELVELCLTRSSSQRRKTIVELVERLGRCRLLPVRFKILGILYELGFPHVARNSVMRMLRSYESRRGRAASPPIAVALLGADWANLRDKRVSGFNSWWEWEKVGPQLLEAALPNMRTRDRAKFYSAAGWYGRSGQSWRQSGTPDHVRAFKDRWMQAKLRGPDSLCAFEAQVLGNKEYVQLSCWLDVAPARAVVAIEAAIERGALEWSDILVARLEEHGSLVAWRRSIAKYITDRLHGSSRWSIWPHDLAEVGAAATLFRELAEMAVRTNGGYLASTLYEAWYRSADQLTKEEAREVRSVLRSGLNDLRGSLARDRRSQGASA